jgi:hypothetical protein
MFRCVFANVFGDFHRAEVRPAMEQKCLVFAPSAGSVSSKVAGGLWIEREIELIFQGNSAPPLSKADQTESEFSFLMK